MYHWSLLLSKCLYIHGRWIIFQSNLNYNLTASLPIFQRLVFKSRKQQGICWFKLYYHIYFPSDLTGSFCLWKQGLKGTYTLCAYVVSGRRQTHKCTYVKIIDMCAKFLKGYKNQLSCQNNLHDHNFFSAWLEHEGNGDFFLWLRENIGDTLLYRSSVWKSRPFYR